MPTKNYFLWLLSPVSGSELTSANFQWVTLAKQEPSTPLKQSKIQRDRQGDEKADIVRVFPSIKTSEGAGINLSSFNMKRNWKHHICRCEANFTSMLHPCRLVHKHDGQFLTSNTTSTRFKYHQTFFPESLDKDPSCVKVVLNFPVRSLIRTAMKVVKTLKQFKREKTL